LQAFASEVTPLIRRERYITNRKNDKWFHTFLIPRMALFAGDADIDRRSAVFGSNVFEVGKTITWKEDRNLAIRRE